MARHILAACVVCLLCADHLPCQQHFETGPIGPVATGGGIPSSLGSNLNMKFLQENSNGGGSSSSSSSSSNSGTVMNPVLKNQNNNRNKNRGNNNSNDGGLTIKDLENHPRLQAAGINTNNLNAVDGDIFDARNPYRNQIPNNYRRLIKSEVKSLQRQKRHAGHDHGNDDDSNLEISPITKEYIKKIFLNYGKKGREMDLENFEFMMKKLKLNKLKLNNGTEPIAATTTTTAIENSIKSSELNNHNDNECSSINDLFEHLYPEVKENLVKEYEELVKEKPNAAHQYQVADPVYKLTKSNIHSMCPILLYQLLSNNINENEGCISHKSLKVTESHKHIDEVHEEYEKDSYLIWTYSTLAVVLCGLLGLVGVAIIPLMNTIFYQQILSFLVALAVGTMTGDALLHLIPHSIVCSTEEQMVRKGLVCVLGIIGFYAVENSFTLISEYRKKNRRKTNSKTNVRVLRENNQEDGAGDKLCKSKYSTDYCYEEVAMDNKEEANNQNQLQESRVTVGDGLHTNYENDKPLPVSVILREHDHTHHGHAHKHGHVHSPPASISAVAWMIILGDGLHNFTDGMAIGAAFSESIPGGFSTSLAVFCHELPHELGDFAILIKAGMTPKAAVAYNCLTAILSFFGMIFGIVFGENDEASRWMFAVAAGLFIYIALVDMMPEMTSAHNTVQQIVLQLLGLVGGVMSMLLIALYEHELMNIFGGHNHSHGCPAGEGHGGGGGHGHSHGGGGHGHSH